MLKILAVVAATLSLSSCLLVPVDNGYGHERYRGHTRDPHGDRYEHRGDRNERDDDEERRG